MKVKSFTIDNRGFLSITRATNKETYCFCPEASNNMTLRCGDWCPHFGEPVYDGNKVNGEFEASLNLTCQSGVTIRGIIHDFRESGK